MIIAGHLVVDPADRDAFVEGCTLAVDQARAARGCLDFAITADTLDPSKVRVFERWEDEDHLLAFRGSGPSDEQQTAILDADVKRYAINTVGDA